jgi:hypothetical protein
MGLDLRVYTYIRKTPILATEDDEGDGGVEPSVRFYSNPDFPNHIGKIDTNYMYMYNNKYWFPMGSYSTFYVVREALKEVPFRSLEKLLNFSDCEGTVCSEYCLEIAKALNVAEELFTSVLVKNNQSDIDFYVGKFRMLQSAFLLGSIDGAVVYA